MRRLWCVAIIVGWLFLGTSAMALPGIDIEAAVGGWQQSPSGQFGYVSSGSLGVDDILDLERDMGYGDELQVTGRLKLDLPIIPTIYLAAAPMQFEGNGQTDGFNFGGVTVPDGSFQSRLTLNQYDVALYYSIPLLKKATLDRLNIDFGLNARIVDYKAEVQQAPTLLTPRGINESESGVVTVPTLYLAAQFQPIERFALEVEGRGLAIGDDKVYSVLGRVRVKVIGPTFVAGGWRWDAIDVDESDVRVDTQFQGPFFEAGVKF